VDSEQDKQANAEPQTEAPKQEAATDGAAATEGAAPQEAAPATASRNRVFIGLGVAAVVIVGAALAMQRSPQTPASTGDTVAADITLITSDRTSIDCSAATAVEPYHCGYTDESMAWKGDEKNKLRPYYTVDRHLYLVPGLFEQPALQDRYKSEPPEGKPRDGLKRFTAKCNLKIAGKMGGVRVRWDTTGAWSNPEEVEVANIIDCKVEG
jgi:hypothetical protein